MKNYSDEFIEATTRTQKLGLPLYSILEGNGNPNFWVLVVASINSSL